ncbi:MAG: CapA family protein, partial [Deltaproteobacteria bacterium]|nr:CapA family protein [Deltaproteobacteria bacterium]
SGFKLVSFANNPVYDQGRKGMIETLDELARAELGFFGAGRTRQEAAKGLRLEKNGVRLAFLGASQFFNQSQHHLEDPQQAHVNKSDDPAATLEAVKAARAEADFVIVSLHWGVEYQPKPRESEVDLAHALFEAGADVILGTHPHILQPLEIYQAQDGRTCLVVYSLGNFVSNQSRQYNHGVSPEKVGDTRDSALLKLSVVRRDYGAGGVRAELADLSFQPLWTENERVKSSGKEQPFIRIVGIERALTVARSELDTFVAALPAKPDKEQMAKVVRLKKRLGLLERRREIIEARLGTDFAAEHLP